MTELPMESHKSRTSIGRPSVSVIIPAYGPSPHLEAVLDALAQGSDQAEQIFVSHSGESDPTSRLATSHPQVTVFHSPERLLASAARNRGMRQASGDILAFCDNDTVPCADWISIIRRFLTPEPAVLVGAVDVERSGGYWGMTTWLCEFSEQAPWGPTREQTGGASCNMAVRRADMVAIGGFPEDFRAGEDTMLLRNLRESGLRQVFEPSLRVGHFNIPGFAHCRRHVFNQGRHFAKVRKTVPMSGHTAVRFWPLAPVLGPVLGLAKGGLVLRRLLSSGRPLFFAKHLPGVLVGITVWTAGLVYAAATGRFTGEY